MNNLPILDPVTRVRYELSDNARRAFKIACDRADEKLTPNEYCAYQHLWLKVHGTEV